MSRSLFEKPSPYGGVVEMLLVLKIHYERRLYSVCLLLPSLVPHNVGRTQYRRRVILGCSLRCEHVVSAPISKPLISHTVHTERRHHSTSIPVLSLLPTGHANSQDFGECLRSSTCFEPTS